MKKDEGEKQIKMDKKSYEQLILRKRLADKQLQNLKSMSLSSLVSKTRKKQPMLPPSPTMDFIRRNYENTLKQMGINQNVEQITEKHLSMMREVERMNIIKRKQMRQAPIFSQIKRGKLGIDNIFILFAIVGSVALPMYFYQRFKKNKEIIIKSRKYPPQVIENIDDDSPIDLDSVSEHTALFENPKKKRLYEMRKKEMEKMVKLERELDL